MRAWLAACLLALPFAGADAVPARRVTAAPAVTLAGTGVILRGAPLNFGMPHGRAMQIATAALGNPVTSGIHPECGGGHPIAYAGFRGGVELSFVRGRFVGWTLDYGGDRRIMTANRVGLGMTAAMLKRLGPMVTIEPGNDAGGGIGPGFSWGNGVHGWLDGVKPRSTVIGLYAGETCIVE